MAGPQQSTGFIAVIETPYVGCCCRSCLHGANASHLTQGTADTLKGGLLCKESKLYSLQQHFSPASLLRRQPRRSLSLTSAALHQSAPTATTDTRPTPAPPTAITGPAISTTESFWAWDPGADGAIATDGADIALSPRAADVITAAPAPLRIAAAAHGPAAVMLHQRVPAHRAHRKPGLPARPLRTHRLPAHQLRTQLPVAADRTAAVVAADMKAAADHTAAVVATNLQSSLNSARALFGHAPHSFPLALSPCGLAPKPTHTIHT